GVDVTRDDRVDPMPFRPRAKKKALPQRRILRRRQWGQGLLRCMVNLLRNQRAVWMLHSPPGFSPAFRGVHRHRDAAHLHPSGGPGGLPAALSPWSLAPAGAPSAPPPTPPPLSPVIQVPVTPPGMPPPPTLPPGQSTARVTGCSESAQPSEADAATYPPTVLGT